MAPPLGVRSVTAQLARLKTEVCERLRGENSGRACDFNHKVGSWPLLVRSGEIRYMKYYISFQPMATPYGLIICCCPSLLVKTSRKCSCRSSLDTLRTNGDQGAYACDRGWRRH